MTPIVRGGPLPADASIPQHFLYWAVTPWRLYSQRTSISLVVSYVAVAVLTVSLVLIALSSVIVWPELGERFGLEDIVIDPYLGEQARAYGQWLDPDSIALDLQNGLDADEQTSITERLNLIVAASVPGFDPPYNADSAFRIAYVAIVSPEGMVLASSDPTWVAPGNSISEFPRRQISETVARTLMLLGEPDPARGALYSMSVSGERTTASYPLITSDGDLAGAIVLEGNPIREVLGFDSRSDLFRYLGVQYRQILWLVALPALVVAIPFGWWRSRSISRRLERLANAADAMAEGELDARSPVHRHDEIGRLAERFNEMAATIENNDRTRRAFVSNVSHELRTPISIIQGVVERWRKNAAPLDLQEAESLDILQRESDMLARMIDDLFTITRGQEQGLRLERRSVDFHALATEAVEGIKNLAWSQSRVSIESIVAPDLPPVLIDPIRIRQVLNNLIYNALRHTPEGGLVVVNAQPAGTMLEVSVSDTGRGIPNDEIDMVFNRYYQVERGQRHDDSSGLGLSVVQQLVQAHGGDIWIHSDTGEGATFAFTLPLAP